jgi:hypothetical protein
MAVGTICALRGVTCDSGVRLVDTRGLSASCSVVVHPHRLLIPKIVTLVMTRTKKPVYDPLGGRLEIAEV